MMMKNIFPTFLFTLLLFQGTAVLADKAFNANQKGMKEYRENKFDASTENFMEAVVERPDSPELKFNLGTSMSESGRHEEAISQLGSAAAELSDPKQRASAFYNSGNTRFLSGDLEGAIKDYTEAVKLDQESKDIRHNLELALRKLEQQQQQQQKNDQNQQKDTEKKEDKKDKDKESKTQNQQDKNKQDDQQQQSQQQESEQQEMTPEEAQRILDALSDEEKKALSLKRMQMKRETRQGDDW